MLLCTSYSNYSMNFSMSQWLKDFEPQNHRYLRRKNNFLRFACCPYRSLCASDTVLNNKMRDRWVSARVFAESHWKRKNIHFRNNFSIFINFFLWLICLCRDGRDMVICLRGLVSNKRRCSPSVNLSWSPTVNGCAPEPMVWPWISDIVF